ncbi:glycosyltransferase family 4 protein [Citrobacter portucalensis]|uniref:glycosyltransferase family 4 protein n=1 Tax=Citrobacter portucalensis TaxID=1639133 RepID=UPI0023AEBFCF|nr:glycosyltransferase family 4 protein [Citrobacter portucalensis]
MSNKYAFVSNIVTPYRVIQLKALERSKYKFDFITTEVNPYRRWTISDEKHVNANKIFSIPYISKKPSIFGLIFEYDGFLITGYDRLQYILLAFLCIVFRKKYYLVFDGVAPSKLIIKRKSFKYILKFIISKFSSGILANGKVGFEYFTKNFYIDKNKIYNQYLNIDVSEFFNDLPKKKLLFRDNHEQKIVLFCGRLMERKGGLELIKSISSMKLDVKLVFAGSGEMEDVWKQKCNELNVKHKFLGNVDRENLSEIYYSSDVLAVPSRDEPWGLVIHEALLCNIPVVCSSDCGSSLDLIDHKVNGFIYEPGDTHALNESILSSFSLDKTRLTECNKKILKEWNNDSFLSEVSNMIGHAK